MEISKNEKKCINCGYKYCRANPRWKARASPRPVPPEAIELKIITNKLDAYNDIICNHCHSDICRKIVKMKQEDTQSPTINPSINSPTINPSINSPTIILPSYPMTRELFDEEGFERAFKEWYEREGKSALNNIYKERDQALIKYKKKMELAEKMKTQAIHLKTEVNHLKTEAIHLKTEANQFYDKANQFYEKANQLDIKSKEMKIEVVNERKEISLKREKIAKEKQNILTKQFYSIFHGKNPLPIEKIEVVFNTYLSDQSLTVESSIEGKSYSKLNSMVAVTKYLNDNPNIKTVDFRILKAEINDIPTLAEYLTKSNIKAIAINSGISSQAKESLNIAVKARNGGLKIQYFA